MNIIVQKFGGTSVSTKENRAKVIEKIIAKKNEGNQLVVVVSAMGRKGDPYSTDTLLESIDLRLIDQKELDLLISFGEVISSITLANEISKLGYKTEVLTGKDIGIITNDNFGSADVIDFDSLNIEKGLKEDKIIVVAGFQGATIDGDVTTLGRGGSDITAALLGGYLAAEYVEIYTDVDGIMTADPRIVKDAQVLREMSYSEVHQLAEDGAKVIHPRAIELAQRFDVPIFIKNTHSNSKGTYIEEINTKNTGSELLLDSDKIMTAITYKKERVQVKIYEEDSNTINRLMKDLVRSDISLDLINFFKDYKVFTIDEDDRDKFMDLVKSYNFDYDITSNCCKISCIGNKMRGVPGVMANIFEALSVNEIDILQTSDSYNTIWCLINEKDLEKALMVLHTRFKLNE